MLLPHTAEDVDLLSLYASDLRPAPPGRPWVLCNMVASLDGATAVGGVSGVLGGAPDRAVFRAVRAIPDVIVAGSGTVRAERYRLPSPDDEIRRHRSARGLSAAPRLAVVSGSLHLEADLPFVEAGAGAAPEDRALVLTAPDSMERFPDRAAALAARVELVPCGDIPGSVDLGAALSELARRGAATVLTEGGPALNGQLLRDGLLDEMVVTIAPTLAGGTSKRMIVGDEHVVELELVRLLEDSGVLFGRYVRVEMSGGSDT